MGFKRFLMKTFIPGYYAYDIAKKVEENGVAEGMKNMIKEDCIDIPVVNQIYNVGKNDGKIEGYEQASYKYEKKLLKQAEEFLNQMNEFSNQKEEYEKLIDQYERYIEKMSAKDSLTNEEEIYLNKIMIMERRLKELKYIVK